MPAQEIISETVGFRLSAQQEWRFADEAPRAAQCAIGFDGPVDEALLRQALESVLARHEILRTTFPSAIGVRGRTQRIHDSPELEWRVESGPAIPLAVMLESAGATDFDLERGPMVHALLVSSAQPRALLVLTVHSACVDAQSLALIASELLDTYAGAAQREEPIQYADYAEWRHEQLTDDEPPATTGRGFWCREIEQAPAAPRVLFASRGPGSRRVRSIAVPLSTSNIEHLQAAAAAAGVTAASFLEACWHATLARVTGADELMVASWCDGRTQADLADAVGCFAQPIPVRSRLGEQTTFAEVLDQVNRGRREAAGQANFATGQDLQALATAAVAAFEAIELPALPAPASGIEALTPPGGALGLSCRVSQGELWAELWHDPALVADSDAEMLAGALATLVVAAGADVSAAVAQLPVIGSEKRQQLLADSEGPSAAALAGMSVLQQFEQHAHAHPSAAAVAGAGRTVSYGELNAQANRIARLLRTVNVQPGSCVGLCLERTPVLLEGMLGILKAGGAYLPLNHEHPAARIAHQLQESNAIALVTEEAMLDRFPAFHGEIVCLDRDGERIRGFSADDLALTVEPEDLAYVMYTSGSTGTPKGVTISHGNLANYAAHMAERLTGPQDQGGRQGLRFGVISAITTDLGNTCIFPALVSGGCVQLIGSAAAMDPALLVDELAGDPVDVLKITPSHLRALITDEGARGVLPRRVLVLGGEALSWELVRRVRTLAPQLRIVNHYGPTETTIGCCAYEVGEPRGDSPTVPVGWPLAGTRAYVLDHGGAPVPPGVPGEICIAGEGVSPGYVGQTDEGAFVPDVSGDGRMYRTGDRARRLQDGAIEFLGRIDDQIKVRGFRVEPGEIETVLCGHGAIGQAAVVAEYDEQGDARLVAYVTGAASPSVEELRAFLGDFLPSYMVPSAFVMLGSLPFTPSGKIDRTALAALGSAVTGPGTDYVAPRDPVEQEIAAIWSELLGVERVGVHDDFFALGGHSLLAAQATMRIRKRHGDIPLRALLAAPTVAALAEAVRGSKQVEHHEHTRPLGSALK